jgi:hypothetical protein
MGGKRIMKENEDPRNWVRGRRGIYDERGSAVKQLPDAGEDGGKEYKVVNVMGNKAGPMYSQLSARIWMYIRMCVPM